MGEETSPILFVGAGPGDPELITVKGRRALERADLVVYAGSLVPRALLQWTGPACEQVDSAGMHLDQIVGCMAAAWSAGRRVVRLHTGDPSLYGAVQEQFQALRRRRIPFAVIPGVTAAFAAAAALEIEFTLPERTQTLILTRVAGRTPVPEAENLAALAAHRSSMAIYLSVAMAEQVGAVLAGAYGAAAPCAVVQRASHPQERILYTTAARLAHDVRAAGIDRQALIVVGPALESGAEGATTRSKLYDLRFSHGYRLAEAENGQGRV
jgi:precorrin-4/cobalt-precorrin-4 C11-methyltransferase